MTTDEKWMSIAIDEANLANQENEVPVGAVLIQNNRLLAKAHNQPIAKNDPTAHAEIQALRIAGKRRKNYRLVGSTLYVTLEPCSMCFGAIIHARVQRIVYGASDPNSKICVSCGNFTSQKNFSHSVEITPDILKNECSKLLKSFFKSRR